MIEKMDRELSPQFELSFRSIEKEKRKVRRLV